MQQPSMPSPPPPAPRAAAEPGGLLVLVGGLLVIVGVFLPWLRATGPLGNTGSANGIEIGTYGTLILGAFAAARGLSAVRPNMMKMTLGTPIIGGALILGLMALRWGRLQDDLAAFRALPGVTASIGIGVWAVIIGGVLVVVGGVQLRSGGHR